MAKKNKKPEESFKGNQILNGQFRDVRKNGDDDVYTFIASTSSPDRHKTILNQKNWKLKNFNANPIIGYQHNVYGGLCNAPDPDDVIGRGHAYVEDDELLVDIVFDTESELATKIKSKVERGFLRACSVGFIEFGDGHRGNEDDGENPQMYYYHGQELLELSIVNIPSNPDAQKKALRSQTYDALQYIYRELGGEYRFSDIENLTVREVIDLLEGKEAEAPIEYNKDIFSLRIAKLRQSALTDGHY
jgi:HK97 family phage prohead protease